ncbi:hypothetical protein ACFHWW_27315 [Ensifer sp. P24N7]|uniref:hypothetical protein n=1 Tax=Sinorhizobium sp. P24N7 TaxID=3348358 RepID=UPI0035F40E1D
MKKGCPHKEKRFCPVYVASHSMRAVDGSWLGCMDGDIAGGRCAVDRGKSYVREVARIKAAHPGLVEERAFQEQSAAEWTAAEERRRKRQAMQGLC